MTQVDILAFGAHPDDVELGCAGTLSLSISQGKSVAIIDLTEGELGTRGDVQKRKKEAQNAANILNVKYRENLKFRDGFFKNDESHQIAVIKKIRSFKPKIVLCNAFRDRHIDHSKGNKLVNESCFLSGLKKIETFDSKGAIQDSWRPRLILEYIQWDDLEPDIILDISGHLDKKLQAVSAFKSQFYNPDSGEIETPISSKNFIESVKYRAQNLGRIIGTSAGEGFTSKQQLSIDNLFDLIRQ